MAEDNTVDGTSISLNEMTSLLPTFCQVIAIPPSESDGQLDQTTMIAYRSLSAILTNRTHPLEEKDLNYILEALITAYINDSTNSNEMALPTICLIASYPTCLTVKASSLDVLWDKLTKSLNTKQDLSVFEAFRTISVCFSGFNCEYSNDTVPSWAHEIGKKLFVCLKEKTVQMSLDHLTPLMMLAGTLCHHFGLSWTTHSSNNSISRDTSLLASIAVIQVQTLLMEDPVVRPELVVSSLEVIEEVIRTLATEEESETPLEEFEVAVYRRLEEFATAIVTYLIAQSPKPLEQGRNKDAPSLLILACVRCLSSWISMTTWPQNIDVAALMPLLHLIIETSTTNTTSMRTVGLLTPALSSLTETEAGRSCVHKSGLLTSLAELFVRICSNQGFQNHDCWCETKLRFFVSLWLNYAMLSEARETVPRELMQIADHIQNILPAFIQDNRHGNLVHLDLATLCMSIYNNSANTSDQQLCVNFIIACQDLLLHNLTTISSRSDDEIDENSLLFIQQLKTSCQQNHRFKMVTRGSSTLIETIETFLTDLSRSPSKKDIITLLQTNLQDFMVLLK